MKTKYKILIAKIIYKFISLFFKKKIYKRNGIFWKLDLSEAIDLHIFIFGNFEPEIKNSAKKLNLDKNKIILDIGANFGVQSLQFANEFKFSTIYSIEPTDYAFSKMVTNLSINKDLSKNIIPYQYFIGTNNQELPKTIYSSWNLEINEKKHYKHFGTEKRTNNASLITLCDFLDLTNIKNIDFIKLDVDGYEFSVIKSGYDFLKKNKTPIFMELAPYLYKEYGYSVNDILELVYSLNYSFYDIHKIKKIDEINKVIESMPDGSSKNIILM